jgi:hypothetical protein
LILPIDVIAIEADALTNTHTGGGEEPEEGVVRLRAKGRCQPERGAENLRDVSR